MAIRYAVAAGNWSATATWNGGTLPASTDDVYANNFAVTIDQTVTVNSLKTISNASPVIAAGGSWTVTAAATVTLTAGIAQSDNVSNTSAVLNIGAGSFAVTLAGGTINGGAGNSRLGVSTNASYTGTLTIGNAIVGGTTVSNAFGLSVNGACTVIINGLVSGATNASASPGVSVTGTNAIVTANGGASGGGTSANGHGISMSVSSGQLTVAGTITGGSAGANGVNISAGSLRVDAMMVYGPTAPVIVTGTGVIMFKRTGSYLGVQAPSDDNWPANTGTNITVQRYTTGNPSPADVRSGTTYGPGFTSTGTLAVPPAASVASGVAVDATTGTAALKLSDVLAGTGNQIAAVFP